MNTYDKAIIQKAIALQYHGGQNAPKIIAKGVADSAQEIIDIARLHDILVHEDPTLSDALAAFDIGQEIPEGLYLVIAELIAFCFVLKGKFPQNWQNIHNKIDIKS